MGKIETIKTLKRQYHTENPLADGIVVTGKDRRVSAGMRSELVDPKTGEVQAVSSIHRVKTVDDAEFVKVFSDGVKAMFGLTRTGARVFQAVLDEYQKTKMSGGFADTLYLPWFNEGLNGEDVGMSKRTFNRGLKELLDNQFLAPRSPDAYWVNPALFFKGDRIAFVKEYRRSKPVDGDAHLQKPLLDK